MHVDEHVVRGRYGLVHLADHDVGGTGGRDDLGCAHPPIMPPPLVEEGRRTYPGLTIALASKCIGSV